MALWLWRGKPLRPGLPVAAVGLGPCRSSSPTCAWRSGSPSGWTAKGASRRPVTPGSSSGVPSRLRPAARGGRSRSRRSLARSASRCSCAAGAFAFLALVLPRPRCRRCSSSWLGRAARRASRLGISRTSCRSWRRSSASAPRGSSGTSGPRLLPSPSARSRGARPGADRRDPGSARLAERRPGRWVARTLGSSEQLKGPKAWLDAHVDPGAVLFPYSAVYLAALPTTREGDALPTPSGERSPRPESDRSAGSGGLRLGADRRELVDFERLDAALGDGFERVRAGGWLLIRGAGRSRATVRPSAPSTPRSRPRARPRWASGRSSSAGTTPRRPGSSAARSGASARPAHRAGTAPEPVAAGWNLNARDSLDPHRPGSSVDEDRALALRRVDLEEARAAGEVPADRRAERVARSEGERGGGRRRGRRRARRVASLRRGRARRTPRRRRPERPFLDESEPEEANAAPAAASAAGRGRRRDRVRDRDACERRRADEVPGREDGAAREPEQGRDGDRHGGEERREPRLGAESPEEGRAGEDDRQDREPAHRGRAARWRSRSDST